MNSTPMIDNTTPSAEDSSPLITDSASHLRDSAPQTISQEDTSRISEEGSPIEVSQQLGDSGLNERDMIISLSNDPG